LAEAEAEHYGQEQKIQGLRNKRERIRLQQQEEQRQRAAKIVDEGKCRWQERLRHQQGDLERRKRAFSAMKNKEEDTRRKAAKEQEEELLHYTELKP
jgi:hypothetical protein